jgi:uncharacterized protein (TIGR02453 family)
VKFDGFPDGMLAFYEGLEADNSKPYWTDHRDVYESCVRAPMEALLAELEHEFGPGKFFRPYRDVRFSRDKSPYKTAAAAAIERADGTGGLYVQVSAHGLLIAGGCYESASDQVDRLRRAVADDVRGPELERVLAELRRRGFEVHGEMLRRTPRGYPADHPRAELLRHRTLYTSRRWPPDDQLHSRAALTRVRTGWRALAGLNGWLHANVGASAEPAPR